MDGSLLRSHDVQRINGVWEYFAFSPATYTVSYPFALCFRRAAIPNFLKWSFFQIADSLGIELAGRNVTVGINTKM